MRSNLSTGLFDNLVWGLAAAHSITLWSVSLSSPTTTTAGTPFIKSTDNKRLNPLLVIEQLP